MMRLSDEKSKSRAEIEDILRRISVWSSLIAMGICILSLVGWFTGVMLVASMSADYVPIAPSSAICFLMVSGSILLCVSRPGSPTGRIAAGIAALFTILICLILLAGFFFGVSFDIEHFGISIASSLTNFPAGHMSPITSVTFLVAATGILYIIFSYPDRQRFKTASAYIALAVISTGFVVIVGYLHGTPFLYGGNIIPMALPTAIAFELIGIGMIAASGPDVPPVRIFTGPTVRNELMRAFLPTIAFFVLVEGVMYKTTITNSGNPAIAASFVAVISVVAAGFIISKIAKSIGGEIDTAHAERDRAEEMLRLDEDRLETLLKMAHLKVESEKELTNFALEEGVRLTKSRGGYLHFFDEEKQTIQFVFWSRSVRDICTATQGHQYPLHSAGLWADSIRLRRPVIHNDYQNQFDKKGYPEGHFHLVRHMSIPIFDGDRIVGVAGVGNKETLYDESDVRQISLFMNSMWTILKERRSLEEREKLILELKMALEKVRTLSGLLPICASCKKIRDDSGYWNQIESYVRDHTEADFTHCVCPECAKKLYPEFYKEIWFKEEHDKGLDKS